MILKGGSRGNPKQLAYHLQRVDTNERVTILELQHPIKDPEEAFYCWQALSEGSPRAKKGLYHLNIDPHERYEMTPKSGSVRSRSPKNNWGLKGNPAASSYTKNTAASTSTWSGAGWTTRPAGCAPTARIT